MEEFECVCGSGNLYQVRTETVSTRVYPTDTDFDLGKEEVIDVAKSRLECGNDHPLLFSDGTEANTFEDYVRWMKEQG